jgi:hypothetical protein
MSAALPGGIIAVILLQHRAIFLMRIIGKNLRLNVAIKKSAGQRIGVTILAGSSPS